MNHSDKEHNLLSKKLSSILLNYVRAVIKEEVQLGTQSFFIGYGPDWRDGSELNPIVMEKFGIRTYLVDRQRSDRPITVIFVLTDKLGEIFKKFDFAPFLNVTLEDNGDDFFEFVSIDDAHAVKHCSPLFTNNKNKNQYASFVEAVEKHLLFTTVQYSS